MSDNAAPSRIIWIIVLYWPDDDTIDFMSNLAKKGLCIVAVVNGILPLVSAKLNSANIFKIIENDQNVGLSRALNQGCQFAFNDGASHVFLLDQDSRPEMSLPQDLLADWRVAEEMGMSVGVIAPILIDIKSFGYKSGHQKTDIDPSIVTDAETLATSGSLISKDAFLAVGPMYDWLFIDGIDHEWCFRARKCQLAVLKANSRVMLHNMGDDGLTLFRRYRPLHRSPTRHRYIIRNTVFMIRQPYVDWRWRLREAIKTLYRIPIYIAISTNKKSTFKQIMFGLIEGLQHKRATKN